MKLWFTGACGRNLSKLVKLYGVHERTAGKAREMLRIALETSDREELLSRLREMRRKQDAE